MQSLLLYIFICEQENCISIGIQILKTGIECCILGYMDVWLLGMPVKKGKKKPRFFQVNMHCFLLAFLF